MSKKLERRVIVAFDFMAGDCCSKDLPKEEKILYNFELGCKAVRRAIKKHRNLRLILTCSTEKLSIKRFADLYTIAVYKLADLVDNGKVTLFASEYIADHNEDPEKAFETSNTTTDAVRVLSGVNLEIPINNKENRIEKFRAHAVVSPGNPRLVDYSVEKLAQQIKDGSPIIKCESDENDLYEGIKAAIYP